MSDKLRWAIVNFTLWLFKKSSRLVGMKARIIVYDKKYLKGRDL
jgi:hypothetical protein